MRHHLLVGSEKKIKILKSAFGTTKRQVLQVAPPYLFAHIKNICIKSALIILNTLAVTLRRMHTLDAGRRTLGAGHMTLSPHYPILHV